jgi:hypothetical protein
MKKWKPEGHVFDEYVQRNLDTQVLQSIPAQEAAVTDQNIQTRKDVKASLGRTTES